MNTYKSSEQLKALAKTQLFGKYGIVVGAIALSRLITFGLNSFSAIFSNTSSAVGFFIDILFTFFILLFSGLLTAGEAYVFLSVTCGATPKASDVFYCFTHNPDVVLVLQFTKTVAQLIPLIPAFILLYAGLYTQNLVWVFPTCICTIIGGILSIYFSLSLSQIFYILLDFPEYSAKQIISLSKTIMKGHKFRLFYIMVSFLPYYFLGIISCFVGFLWIIPYQNATYTNFYLDLMRNRALKEA